MKWFFVVNCTCTHRVILSTTIGFAHFSYSRGVWMEREKSKINTATAETLFCERRTIINRLSSRQQHSNTRKCWPLRLTEFITWLRVSLKRTTIFSFFFNPSSNDDNPLPGRSLFRHYSVTYHTYVQRNGRLSV